MIFTYMNRFKLNNDTNTLFKTILYERRRKDINECPHCKSKKIIKFGKYNGIQRYKCNCCKRTFSLTTNSVWYYSKKKVDDWTNFIEMMLEKKSLRLAARKVKISLTTAFYWRHKLMDAMCENNKIIRLDDYVHILASRVSANYKGSRKVNIKGKDIWIVTAKGEHDSIMSEPISEGIWSYEAFNEKVYSKVSSDAFIKSYRNRYVYAVAKVHNIRIEKKERKVIDRTIEGYFNMFHRWFSSFRGIATKYLKEYLNWYMMFYREKKYYCFGYMREIVKVRKYIRTFEIGMED